MNEARLRQAESDVHHDGFEDDGGDLSGIFFEAALDGGEIVERGDKDVGNRGLRNAEASGHGDGIVNVAEFGSVRLDAD